MASLHVMCKLLTVGVSRVGMASVLYRCRSRSSCDGRVHMHGCSWVHKNAGHMSPIRHCVNLAVLSYLSLQYLAFSNAAILQ